MQAAVEGGAAASGAAAGARRPLAAPALGAAALAVLVGSVLAGGGSQPGRLLPLGAIALLAAGAGVAAVLLGRLPSVLHGPVLVLVGLLGGHVAWLGASIVWSFAPDASWESFNRGAVYVALLVLGALVGGTLPRAPRVAAVALAAVLGAMLLWALAGVVVPALGPDVDRSARLREPVGYWNALALLLATAVPLWLWAAARRSHAAAVRAVAVAALVLTLVALVLTASRGGLLVAAVAGGAWLVLGRPRLEGAVALALAAGPAAAVSAWAVSRPGLLEATASAAQRERDGALLGAALVLGGALAGTLAYLLARAEARRPLAPEARRRLGRAALAAAAASVVLALVVGLASVGDPVAWADARFDEFRNPPTEQLTEDAGRLGDFSSNHRWTWWTEAWTIWQEQPVRGSGAGSFPLARMPLREDHQRPLAPHNAVLAALSETGLVGAALLLAFAAAAVAAVAGALRRLEGADRAAAAALAAGLAAYAVHSLLDMGWEYVAASAPAALGLGVLAGAGRPARRAAARPLAAAAAAGVALVLVASLASPRAAEREADAAFDALARGDAAAGAEHARRARSLSPLAPEPLYLEAAAAEVAGDRAEAGELYAEAVRRRPRDPEPWFYLGRWAYEEGRLELALRTLDRSYALDHLGPSGPLLDVVREEIAARG